MRFNDILYNQGCVCIALKKQLNMPFEGFDVLSNNSWNKIMNTLDIPHRPMLLPALATALWTRYMYHENYHVTTVIQEI